MQSGSRARELPVLIDWASSGKPGDVLVRTVIGSLLAACSSALVAGRSSRPDIGTTSTALSACKMTAGHHTKTPTGHLRAGSGGEGAVSRDEFLSPNDKLGGGNGGARETECANPLPFLSSPRRIPRLMFLLKPLAKKSHHRPESAHRRSRTTLPRVDMHGSSPSLLSRALHLRRPGHITISPPI